MSKSSPFPDKNPHQSKTTSSPHGDQNPYSTPLGYQQPQHAQHEGDSTGGIIPYKNPHALIAYYLGIIALLPVIGVPFGIASIILGIKGLQNRKKNPIIKGSVHAWIGIAGGVFSLICGSLMTIAMVVSMVG